jgi:hypothetical protein
VWDLWPEKKGTPKVNQRDHREENDPGFERADVTPLIKNRYTMQRFAYDVDVLEPVVAILPMQAVPGWQATLDDQPVPVFSAGPDMLGVYLKEGAHRLVFTWHLPKLGLISLLMTFCSLALVLGILSFAAVRRIRLLRR